MKTSELLKRIKEVGYEYKLSECYLKVFISERDLKEDEHYIIVNINQTIEGIKTRNGMSISSNQSRTLVRLILDYLDTPIEEREEEKKQFLDFNEELNLLHFLNGTHRTLKELKEYNLIEKVGDSWYMKLSIKEEVNAE